MHSKNFIYSVFIPIIMKKISLAIILLLIIFVGACLVSANSVDEQLPNSHDGDALSFHTGGGFKMDSMGYGIQHHFHEEAFDSCD